MSENSALKLLLQKQITSQQYKIIDDYKRTAENLQRQQERNKINSSKLQQLQKKISCLEFMNTTSLRQTNRYQRKLQKLESTQNYANHLLKMKYQSYVDMENNQNHKREECLTKRELMANNRKLSMSVYDRRKSDRIKRIREQDQRISMDLKRRSSQLQADLQEKREAAKEQVQRMKDRKRRYEIFKLQRAAINYNQKLENQLNLFKEQTEYLQELKNKVKKEEQIFRKTQVLNKETLKIESIYLTGADLE